MEEQNSTLNFVVPRGVIPDKENFITLKMATAPIDYAKWGYKVSGKKYVYTINDASNDDDSTKISFAYDRSKAGAEEEIELSEMEVEIKYKSAGSETWSNIQIKQDSLIFNLDMYHEPRFEGFNPSTDIIENELINDIYAPCYRADILLNKKVNVGDQISIELKSAKVTGRGIDDGKQKVDLRNICFSIINDGQGRAG